MAEDPKSVEKVRGVRTLIISAMFGVFLSVVVFVVLTYLFVIPRQLDHDQRIQRLEARVAAVEEAQAEPEDPEAAVEAEAAAAEAPDAAPAVVGGVPAPL